MLISGHMYGGASVTKKMKLGAAQVNSGIIMMGGATSAIGAIPVSAASFTTAYGLALDVGTYSATPAAGAEGLVSVDVRPDQIIKALMSGGATENTALTVLQTTSNSATVMTDADVGTADLDGGMIWGLAGANVGQSRSITAWSSGTSLTISVQFPNQMTTTDTYLACPWNLAGTGVTGEDGPFWLTTTTLFTQARVDAAAAAGGEVSVVDLELNGRSDSYVSFLLRLHAHASAAGAS